MQDADLAARYPALYALQRWEWGGLDAAFSTAPAPDHMVTNIHVVAYVADRVVLCRDARDVWFLPGGTREEGESIRGCVDRELMEEAGARLTGPLVPIGAHHCVSDRAAPYRPHQPHPHKYWLWCAADAELVGPPTMPADAEQIVEVCAVPVVEAGELLLTGGLWLADLVALSAEIRTGPVRLR